MRAVDIIRAKRDGKTLSAEELTWLVREYGAGRIPDYQMSAFLMAVYFNGLTPEETHFFTRAMVEQSDRLDLHCIPGTPVDKHSTGGVGDKTTIVLVPLLASLDVPVVKLSGRGLGHTGGTIDKLESIPGFNTALSPEEILTQVRRLKAVMAGHTKTLVPVDQRLYHLRDVTGTVESLPLIAASVMSKKIASGARALVLDVKVGSGAFMKDLEKARTLAQLMVEIGRASDIRTVALLTDMSQPLGYAVGNSLEVREAIETLKGRGPEDLTLLCVELAAWALFLSRGVQLDTGRKLARDNLTKGVALERFMAIVQAQGGEPKVISDYDLLPQSAYKEEIRAQEAGFVQEIDAEKVGTAAMLLGAGRATKEDEIDLGAGLELLVKRGAYVEKGQPLVRLYTNRSDTVTEAGRLFIESIVIGPAVPAQRELVIDHIG
ncbi:MAG TPA: thymidine phosphorylase [Firmicutes bacterium]|nr:thymidine phosphorylase [Bacillota bacterium]